MNEDFVPFELSKKLKEKGFDKCCNAYYHIYEDETDSRNSFEFTGDMGHHFLNSNNQHRCAAPTISQVLKWLREEKTLFVLPRIDDLGWCYSIHSDLYWDGCGSLLRSSYHAKSYFETYEEACLAGIEYTLDNLI